MSRKKKFLFACLIWAIFLLVCELGLRAALDLDTYRPVTFTAPHLVGETDAQEPRFVTHPYLPFAGKPGITKTIVEHHPLKKNVVINYTNNSYGFRTREFPSTKGPDDYYILCFGGSTTWGLSESNDTTWPALLEKKLRERYPDRRIFVFNLAIDAASSPTSVVNYSLIGVHLHPDLVIVYHGMNELWQGLGAANFRTDYSHAQIDLHPDIANPRWKGLQGQLPESMFHSAVVSVVTKLIDRRMVPSNLSDECVVDYPRDEDPLKGIEVFLQNLRTMHAIAKGTDAQIIFSTFQFYDSNSEPSYLKLNQELKKFFASTGYMFVDQETLIPDKDSSIHVDDCHFTQRGREMMAHNYFDFIVENRLLE